jgi:hypothetical protein
MSTLRVNTLQNTSTTDGGISIDTSGHVTVDGVAMPSSGPLSNRNLIINGAMQVAQRGTTFTGVGGSSLEYTMDRWAVREATDAVIDVSQATDSPSTDLFKYCLKLDVTTADTSIASGQVCTVQHRVEAQDLVLAGFGTANAKQLTISFWHKHTKTGTYSVGFTNHNGTRGYPAEYTQSVSDTWEKSTVTFTADTTGTWATDNTLGMIVYFSVAAGTDFHSTVGAWTGANDFASANQVNALDSTSNSFRLTGVQLEVGSVATPFEHRSFGDELARCQRYYEKTYNVTTAPGTAITDGFVNCITGTNGTGTAIMYFRFATPKRAQPTATFYHTNGTINSWAYSRSGTSGTASPSASLQETGGRIYLSTGANWTVADLQGHVVANAEL